VEAFEQFPSQDVLKTLAPSQFALMFGVASQYMGVLTDLNKHMKYEL